MVEAIIWRHHQLGRAWPPPRGMGELWQFRRYASPIPLPLIGANPSQHIFCAT
jgi:hypothetical protein